MANGIIDELVTLLGFKEDPNSAALIDKFSQKMENVYRIANRIALEVSAGATALMYFAEKSAFAGAEIERFHRLTGMSTESIQLWSYAAQQVSGNKESILRDIETLTVALNPIMPQQFNQGLFLMFGPRLREMKDVNQVLTEMSKVFKTLSPAKALQWGNLIGISPETVLLIRNNLDMLFSRAKNRILSPEEVQRAYEFSQLWNDLKDRVEKFSQHLAVRLFPIIERLVTRFERWWDANQRIISSGLDRFISGISAGMERFLQALDRLKGLSPVVAGLFNLFTDPKIVGGAAFAALMGVAAALGVIALKYIAIGTAVVAAVAAIQELSDKESATRRKLNNRVWEDYKDKPAWFKKLIPEFMTPHPPETTPMPPGPLDRVREMLDNLTKLQSAPIPSYSAPTTNWSGGTGGQGGQYDHPVVQHNQDIEINIDATRQTPYATSDEAVRRLNAIPSTDFKTMGPAAPVN